MEQFDLIKNGKSIGVITPWLKHNSFCILAIQDKSFIAISIDADGTESENEIIETYMQSLSLTPETFNIIASGQSKCVANGSHWSLFIGNRECYRIRAMRMEKGNYLNREIIDYNGYNYYIETADESLIAVLLGSVPKERDNISVAGFNLWRTAIDSSSVGDSDDNSE